MKQISVALLAAAAATLACAESTTYQADPAHTFVTFEVVHAGTSTLRGRFDRTQGTVTMDPAAQRGTAEFTIDTTSVSTGVAPLDKQLKGRNFFRTAEFPNATFTSEQFTFNGDDDVQTVEGTLTMLGKTLPVALRSTSFNCYQSQQLKRPVCGGDFDTTIERSQWGMDYGLQDGIPDEIRLLIQVEAVQQKP